MRGITLAGGSGTRLNPITLGIPKQLVSAYGKPMVYCPLSTLMLAEIQSVLVITTPHDTPSFHRLLGGGSQLGVNLSYTVQQEPNGLARAFILGADFTDDDSAALALGNNASYDPGMGTQLRHHINPDSGVVYAYQVANPTAYGMVEFDENFKTTSTGEKPTQPRSNYAVPSLYFYDNDVVEIVKNLQPSARGEYKITGVGHAYLEADRLTMRVLPRDTVWFDTDTFDSLADVTSFTRTVQHRQGPNIGAPEETVWRIGFIDDEGPHQHAEFLVKSRYGAYLLGLLDNQQS